MSDAYVDTSMLVAMLFGEPGSDAVTRRVEFYSRIVSSNLLEAELRSVCRRDARKLTPGLLSELQWIEPDRPLSAEIKRVLSAGYVRGADCWHLAAALFVAPEPGELTFLTLDKRQRDVATTLGFRTE